MHSYLVGLDALDRQFITHLFRSQLKPCNQLRRARRTQHSAWSRNQCRAYEHSLLQISGGSTIATFAAARQRTGFTMARRLCGTVASWRSGPFHRSYIRNCCCVLARSCASSCRCYRGQNGCWWNIRRRCRGRSKFLALSCFRLLARSHALNCLTEA